MKIQAKQLTSEDFGNRIIHTDKHGTETSRILTGIKHELPGSYLSTPESGETFIKAAYLVSHLSFLDGSKMAVPGKSEVEIDEVTKPVEWVVSNPGGTGLR